MCLALVDGERDVVVPAPDVRYWYTTFTPHIMGQGEPFITPAQSYRVTELALRIQRALDDGDTVDLRPSQMAHRS